MGLVGFVFEIAVLCCLVCGIASNAAVVGKKEDGPPYSLEESSGL